MANNKSTPDGNVGYGKPPRHTQFKPGRSGNPKGRPKGRANLRSLLEKQLYKVTKVRVGGRVKNVPLLEIGIMKLLQGLAHGDPKQTITILKFLLPLLTPEQGCPMCANLRQLSDEELDQRLKQELLKELNSLSDKELEDLLEQVSAGGV